MVMEGTIISLTEFLSIFEEFQVEIRDFFNALFIFVNPDYLMFA